MLCDSVSLACTTAVVVANGAPPLVVVFIGLEKKWKKSKFVTASVHFSKMEEFWLSLTFSLIAGLSTSIGALIVFFVGKVNYMYGEKSLETTSTSFRI